MPCTGGCTWRWSAAGETWLKYGSGNCSDGCSCQAPSEPGTEDGEYQTVSCGRLTCQTCCDSANCCPIDLTCCNPPKRLPRILYVTLSDPNNVWPCIDGVTVAFHYRFTSVGGGYRGHSFERSPVYSSPYDRALLCANAGYYTFGDSFPGCNQTPQYDCDTNVYTYGNILISDPFIEPGPCKISIFLTPHVAYKFKYYTSSGCVLSPCNTVQGYSNYNLNSLPQDMPCEYINNTFELNIVKCHETIDPPLCTNTHRYFGATSSGTILATITE